MKITYKNKGIEKICTNASAAERKHGRRMAEVIHTRIDQIASIDTVEMMIQYHIGRCHAFTCRSGWRICGRPCTSIPACV